MSSIIAETLRDAALLAEVSEVISGKIRGRVVSVSDRLDGAFEATVVNAETHGPFRFDDPQGTGLSWSIEFSVPCLLQLSYASADGQTKTLSPQGVARGRVDLTFSADALSLNSIAEIAGTAEFVIEIYSFPGE